MKKLIIAAAVGALALTGCRAKPGHIITTEDNKLMDIGPGVHWDIQMNGIIDQADADRAIKLCETDWGGTFVFAAIISETAMCLDIEGK